jgi:hypothetical protein
MNFCLKLLMLLSFVVPVAAQSETADSKPIFIRSISLFRSQVELAIERNNDVKVGSHLLAESPSHHKCLLIVTRIKSGSAYTDASRCPGFATLKKGQKVQLTADNEVNEEIREATKSEMQTPPVKN